jgi:hypothetical protein
VAWSPRRRGHVLVVVGALLGALSGVILGLAVDDPQTPTAVAAPGAGRRRGAGRPSTEQPTHHIAHGWFREASRWRRLHGHTAHRRVVAVLRW